MEFIKKYIARRNLYVMFKKFVKKHPELYIEDFKIQILKMLLYHTQISNTSLDFDMLKVNIYTTFNKFKQLYPSIEWITEICDICGSSVQLEPIENRIKVNTNNVESFLEKMTLKTEECNDLFCLYLIYYVLDKDSNGINMEPQNIISKEYLYIMIKIRYTDLYSILHEIRISLIWLTKIADTTFKFFALKEFIYIEFIKLKNIYPSIEWINEISNICDISNDFIPIEKYMPVKPHIVDSFKKKMMLKITECNDLFCLHLLDIVLDVDKYHVKINYVMD